MKRSVHFYAFLILVFVSLLVVPAAFAEGDDHGEPLDENANACDVGGSLEGQCHTEEDWKAGWFLIRYEHGEYDLQSFPEEYDHVLPSDPGDGSHDDDGSHSDDHGDDHSDDPTGGEICEEPLPGEHAPNI